jgi:hypothetical protein
METTMRKLLTFLIALGAVVFAIVSPASAQGFNGGGFNIGLGPFAAAGYVGPGDISFNSSTANVKAYFSCSRVLNNAKATTATSMCDLVDNAAPTVVICTLHGTTSGFVDLSTAGCGGTTPAAKRAATSTTKCNVSKAYDQTGNGNDVSEATAAVQPFLTFGAINSLPVMTCTAGSCVMLSGISFTQAQPFVITVVGNKQSSLTAQQPFIAASTTSNINVFGGNGSVNQWGLSAGLSGGITGVNDNAWHGATALFSGSGSHCAINIDGTNNTGIAVNNCGTNAFSAEHIDIFRAPGSLQLAGSIAEAMIVGGTASTGDLTNEFNNQNSSNGYNGNLP